MMDEVDRPEIGRTERTVGQRNVAVRKDPGVAKVDAGLMAELGAEPERVEQRPGGSFVDEVGLVEDVLPVGLVVVGRQIEVSGRGIYRASWKDVLIELLIVGDERAVLDRQAVLEVVLDEGHSGIYVGERPVQRRAAEELGQIAARRERRRRIGQRAGPE